MPNFSAKWGLMEQLQAVAAGTWTGLPLYELYAWGQNTAGQLGLGDVANRSSPVQVGTLGNWSRPMFSGGPTTSNSASVKSDGTLWTWGTNQFGNLGITAIPGDYKSSPVQVGTGTTWYQVSAGNQFMAAVKTDGTLWAWGRNDNGQLGDGTVVDKSSPVQIGALTNWAQVSAAYTPNVAAVKTDGTLWTWGNGGSGQLGSGNILSRSSPVQVGALTNWYQVFAGNSFVLSVKTDGTLWSWGNNNVGQLGQGNVIRRSSPVQIGSLTNWSKVSAGASTGIAVKTDGTLWGWGFNSQGTIGDGTIITRSSPVQVGALTNWSKVSCGGYHSGATKIDGTLWVWGYNNRGQLGNDTVVSRSSPVQLGALANWYEVSAGRYHTLAILQGATN